MRCGQRGQGDHVAEHRVDHRVQPWPSRPRLPRAAGQQRNRGTPKGVGSSDTLGRCGALVLLAVGADDLLRGRQAVGGGVGLRYCRVQHLRLVPADSAVVSANDGCDLPSAHASHRQLSNHRAAHCRCFVDDFGVFDGCRGGASLGFEEGRHGGKGFREGLREVSWDSQGKG